jgi:predicted ABC-type ATPase
MKDLINWHELSRRLSGSGQNIRPNAIPKKYERKVNRLLWILDLWNRWANRV